MCSAEKSVAETSERLRKTGAKFLHVPCDASDKAQVDVAFSTIKRELGIVNVLVFNSGGGFNQGPILDLTKDNFVQPFTDHVLGALFVSQAVLPDMSKRNGFDYIIFCHFFFSPVAAKEGCILYTSATSAVRANAKNAPFSVAKHGMYGDSQVKKKLIDWFYLQESFGEFDC